ncbi:MAG: Rab family GTPase [Promethearchaeota archaeon]
MTLPVYSFKTILLGNGSAIKIAFLKRYCYNIFNPSERLTVGVDFHVKMVELDNKRCKLRLWDVGGEERFRLLLPQYCKGANGAFFLYDITDQSSLNHVSEWIEIIRENAGDIPIVLIRSKLDLKEYREVSRDDGILVVKNYNFAFLFSYHS